jgi:hypothetical protein
MYGFVPYLLFVLSSLDLMRFVFGLRNKQQVRTIIPIMNKAERRSIVIITTVLMLIYGLTIGPAVIIGIYKSFFTQ